MTAITIFPQVLVDVDRPAWRSYAALAALQVADVGLTALVLGVGGTEQNPLARMLMHTGWSGLVFLLLVKLCIVVALYQKQVRVRLASAVYSAVVLNNLLMGFLYLYP